MSDSVEGLLNFAIELSDVSRKMALEWMERGFTREQKPDKSFVTEADKSIEDHLRKRIHNKYPKHGILGEEGGWDRRDSKLSWILDPIDGTLSFLQGIPLYGTIIAVIQDGHPIVGLIDHPGISWRVSAAKGKGSWKNNKKNSIENSKTSFTDEIIACSDRANFIRSDKVDILDILQQIHPRVRTYSDCFGHSLAATGAVGAMIDMNICFWDIAATKIIVEEAGGKFQLIEKTKEKRIDNTKYSFVAGKKDIVEELAQSLNVDVISGSL